MDAKSLPKMVFITGIDGSGKTLLASRVVAALRDMGVRSSGGWSRHGNYFSRPLLALCLLTGHNRRERHAGVRFGYYEFWKSPALARLYLLLQKVDVSIANYWRLYRKQRGSQILVCDRGPYDTIVDIMLATRIDLTRREKFSGFLRWIPSSHEVIHLTRPPASIFESRPELRHDSSLSKKLALYQELQGQLGWSEVANDDSPDVVAERILSLILAPYSATRS